MRRREALTGLAYAAVPLAGFLAFFIVPFFITVYMTFTGGVGGTQFVGMANYVSILQSDAFQLAAANTFRFIAVGVPTIMAVGLLLALLLNQKLRGTAFFRPVYVLPLVLPVASVTLFFQIMFEKAGVLNHVLAFFGADPVDFLHSSSAFGVLVLLYVWKNVGYNVILFLAGLSAIPQEYYEAARIDGATSRQQLWYITMPLLGPTFFFVLIMSIINSFKAFREAFALGGSYPDSSIYMLQHFMNNNFQNVNYQRLSVAALLTFLVIFVFVFVLWRMQKRGESGR